jgi:hypothetical protein
MSPDRSNDWIGAFESRMRMPGGWSAIGKLSLVDFWRKVGYVSAFIGHVLFRGASHSPGLSSRSYLNTLIAAQFQIPRRQLINRVKLLTDHSARFGVDTKQRSSIL